MKKNLLLSVIMLLLSSVLVKAQHTCCNMLASNNEAFLSDPAFINAHLPPLPFTFVPSNGKMITFKTPDGKDANAFQVVGKNAGNRKLFVFHEWWGLNDYIKQEAEKLSEELGTTVIALDLYDGKVTGNPDEASKLAAGLNDDRVRAIILGAIDFCGKESEIQTIGWCMGGKWSLQAALMAGPNAKGCVVYYGMPETDLAKLKKLNCPVVGIFGKQDKWITPDVVAKFKSDMSETGKQLTIYSYDADHAFANPSNPKFNKEAAGDAMQKALAFMKKNYK